MILDNENQQKVIMSALNATNWPGQVIEEVVKVKVAVASAQIGGIPEVLMEGTSEG